MSTALAYEEFIDFLAAGTTPQLIAEEDTFFGCQIDHIIGEKHGGPTSEENLALACAFCNQANGSDLGSIDWASGSLVSFFNPRENTWGKHFAIVGAEIVGLTPTGEVTSRIFGFNNPDRLLERQLLIDVARYPSPAAATRVGGSID